MKQIILITVILQTYISGYAQEAALKDTQRLSEVIVRGQKPLFQQRPDGTIVNVQGSILSKGSSIMQVLERSPGVFIDQRNNSLVLNGKTGVTIMLDGKILKMPPDQVMTMLNSMPANTIASIELLTTPGAAYDAEGDGGVINIITRRNRSTGTTGTVSLTAGQGWGEKGAATITLDHNRRKVSLRGSYSFNHDRTYSNIDILSFQNMPVFGGQLTAIYRDTAQRNQQTHDAMAGVDVRPDSLTTLGASVRYNNSAGQSDIHTVASYDLADDSLVFDGNILRRNFWRNTISSFYLEKILKNKSRLNINLDHLHYSNRQPSEVINSFNTKDGAPLENDTLFGPQQRGYSGTVIRGFVLKTDYSARISKKLQFEAGVKGSFTKSNSSSFIQSLVDGDWVNRDETSTGIGMIEKIGAAYSALNITATLYTNVVLGLRYEYSDMYISYPESTTQSTSRRKGVLFPNVAITRKVGERSEWLLSYSKRISRPTYNDLASYSSYSDPSAIYIGNPLLQPSISHTLKIGYNVSGYSFALLAGRDLQTIARFQLMESPSRDLLYVTPVNIPEQRSLQFQATVPVNVKSWWKMSYFASAGLRTFELNHTLTPAVKHYSFINVNASHTFLLPRGLSMEWSAWLSSPWYNGSVKMKGVGAVNAGVKKDLRKQAGTLQLSVSDIFRTMSFNSYYGAVTREAFDVSNHVEYNSETARVPVFKLTYSHSFGRGSSTSRRSPVSESAERIRTD
ncbi:MAG: TonB-dependent receptor [Chitinophagaceae bacterium]|nr:MAG: TonB-dependent receptor [Chitinophagaceae bacterium]